MMHNRSHVHRNRPQSQLPTRHPPARGLARRPQDRQAHLGQSLPLASAEDRSLAPTVARRNPGLPPGAFQNPANPSSRPRPSRPRHHPQAGPGVDPLRQTLPGTRSGGSVMTDGEGRPVSVQVYPGNTADPKTVVDQVEKLRQKFGLSRVVLVGDRGMLTQPQIDKIKRHAGWGWITALTSVAIRSLVKQGALQLSLLDEKNLVEIASPDYPGERLMACYNPLLAEERDRKRRELLEATEKGLRKISQEVARRKKKLLKAAEIGLKVGKVLGRYKMGKHFDCTIGEGSFQWARREDSIQQEAKLDGIYVIRTSESQARLSPEATVRSYKSLSEVERAFRCLKGMDLRVRPIHHRTEERVPAHIFLCLLAYYVEWHLRRAWAPILFQDEERTEARERRDPVGPAKPSASARRKKISHQTGEGLPVHSFETLMAELAARARVTYSLQSGDSTPIIKQVPEPTPLQARAYELIELLPVAGN